MAFEMAAQARLGAVNHATWQYSHTRDRGYVEVGSKMGFLDCWDSCQRQSPFATARLANADCKGSKLKT